MTPYFDVRYTAQGTRITIAESVIATRRVDRLLPHYVSFYELRNMFFEMIRKIDLNYAQECWNQFVESYKFKGISVLIGTSEFTIVNHMVQQLYHTQTNEQCSHFLNSNEVPYVVVMVDYENYGLWTLTKARAADLVDSYLLDTVTDPRSAIRGILTILIHMTSFTYNFVFCNHVLYDAAANGGGVKGWTSLMQRITTEEFIRNLSFDGDSEKDKERKCQVYKRCWDLVLQKRWGEV